MKTIVLFVIAIAVGSLSGCLMSSDNDPSDRAYHAIEELNRTGMNNFRVISVRSQDDKRGRELTVITLKGGDIRFECIAPEDSKQKLLVEELTNNQDKVYQAYQTELPLQDFSCTTNGMWFDDKALEYVTFHAKLPK